MIICYFQFGRESVFRLLAWGEIPGDTVIDFDALIKTAAACYWMGAE